VADAMSVSELTGHLKAVLEATFPSLWVAGEIANLSRPRSGHLYLTLKDERAQIRGVIWRSTAARLPDKLEDGQAVLCFGHLDLYAARGNYQLVIRKVQPQGIGALQLAFSELQAKLNAEGLFAAERKRPLPTFPGRLAVITSPSGAAIRDFLKAAENRWHGVEILVVPAVVQGREGAPSIVQALKTVHRLRPRPDVVVLTRGGGSLEDLWAFNEEAVVRAVAASQIPTVSAVGHEVDVTLCDLAADQRALTPTDAATRALPDRARVDRVAVELQQRLHRLMRQLIEVRKTRLIALQGRSVIRRPHEMIQMRSRQLDEWDARGRRAMEAKLKLQREKIATAAASLSALSPLDVLSRGYSVTTDLAGQAVRDAADLQLGQTMRSRLHRGVVESKVTRIDEAARPGDS
jgi:exodeoxyribonuclease VII large subunit